MTQLVDLIDEHRSAFEYDLMRCGSRLRDFPDNGVSWRDLLVLVEQGQHDPASAIRRALDPDWHWGTSEMLLAEMIDALHMFAHQHAVGSPHLKAGKPPKPIPRPGYGGNDDTETIGGGTANSLPIDEMADWLGGPFAALNN